MVTYCRDETVDVSSHLGVHNIVRFIPRLHFDEDAMKEGRKWIQTKEYNCMSLRIFFFTSLVVF